MRIRIYTRNLSLGNMLLLSLVLMNAPVTARSQVSQSNPYKLQANLSNEIDAGHVKVGQVFHMKALSDWHDSACTLRKGAEIQGHVSAVEKHSAPSSASRVALVIDSANCQEQKHDAVDLVIMAMIAPDMDEEHLHAVMPHEIGPGGGIDASTGHVANDDKITPDVDPATVQPGEVRGLKGVQLTPGSTGNAVSLLVNRDHNIKIYPNTLFFLTPPSRAPVAVEMKPVN